MAIASPRALGIERSFACVEHADAVDDKGDGGTDAAAEVLAGGADAEVVVAARPQWPRAARMVALIRSPVSYRPNLRSSPGRSAAGRARACAEPVVAGDYSAVGFSNLRIRAAISAIIAIAMPGS